MMTFNGELLEIFSWMPPKVLYKLSSVCKSSSQLLSDDFFIRKQCEHMQLLGDTEYFIEPNYSQWQNNYRLELHPLRSNSFCGQKLSGSLPPKSVEFLAKKCYILASSNGLLCCRNLRISDDENPLFLFNPTTKSFLSILAPDERSVTDLQDFNIIFDGEKNEGSFGYLLMAIVSPDIWGEESVSKIYSPEERIWTDVGRVYLGSRGMLFEFSVHLNGVVYMISDNGKYLTKQSRFYWPYVVAYEIKNSSSKFLEIPKEARKGLEDAVLRIFKWGNPGSSNLESICLVRLLKKVFTVWVLVNKQHNGYYWHRGFKMRVKAMGLQQNLNVWSFTVVNGSVLLFATHEKVYSVDLINGQKAKLERMHRYGRFIWFTSFCSTLRPIGPGAKTLSLS